MALSMSPLLQAILCFGLPDQHLDFCRDRPVQGLALGLALLINQKLRGINIFRTIYFMPVVVSIIVV